MNATLIPKKSSRVVTMEGFLAQSGGKSILHFGSATEASDAAWTLRNRHPDLVVTASYDKVFVELPREEEE